MSFSAAETRVENCAGRTVFIQTRHTFPCTGVLPVLFPQNKSFIRFGMDAGNAVRSRVVNCTFVCNSDTGSEHRRMRYIHSARCACYGLRKLCCCVLGIVYANERTNERTNEIMERAAVLSSTCGCFCAICVTCCCAKEAWSWSGILFALRYCSMGIIITCFRADFNLWGRFLIGNGYQLSRQLPIIHYQLDYRTA